MRIFTYKLATYLSTDDVASLQNALFCGSYRVRLLFYCMSPVDMMCKYGCMDVCVHVSQAIVEQL